jgi:hypothetical protein
MRTTALVLAIVSTAWLAVGIETASAQASRTWVSGVGDDANPCSRTAPCKTFAGAISKTAAGGEIDALDPGGFGALTITKAITIDGGGGQVASVLVSGTNGIVVAANNATDVVILRNLRINGIGSGLNGVQFLSGLSLLIENCDIFDFLQSGIHMNTAGTNKMVVLNTTVHNNLVGGIQINPTGGSSRATVTDVLASNNGFGIGVDTTGGGTLGLANISRSTISSNTGNGVQVNGANAVALINGNTIPNNNNGVSNTAGTVFTFLNNEINANISNNTVGTITTASPNLQ